LRNKQIEGIGDKRVVNENTGEVTKLGAGGWGGGVNLAVSDENTQKRNSEMLKKFLKQQRKRLKKQEKEKQAAKDSNEAEE
jgi:hypothetical protein